jgi:hypothetical protein
MCCSACDYDLCITCATGDVVAPTRAEEPSARSRSGRSGGGGGDDEEDAPAVMEAEGWQLHLANSATGYKGVSRCNGRYQVRYRGAYVCNTKTALEGAIAYAKHAHEVSAGAPQKVTNTGASAPSAANAPSAGVATPPSQQPTLGSADVRAAPPLAQPAAAAVSMAVASGCESETLTAQAAGRKRERSVPPGGCTEEIAHEKHMARMRELDDAEPTASDPGSQPALAKASVATLSLMDALERLRHHIIASADERMLTTDISKFYSMAGADGPVLKMAIKQAGGLKKATTQSDHVVFVQDEKEPSRGWIVPNGSRGAERHGRREERGRRPSPSPGRKGSHSGERRVHSTRSRSRSRSRSRGRRSRANRSRSRSRERRRRSSRSRSRERRRRSSRSRSRERRRRSSRSRSREQPLSSPAPLAERPLSKTQLFCGNLPFSVNSKVCPPPTTGAGPLELASLLAMPPTPPHMPF